MEPQIKPWYESKTLWVNALAVAIGVLSFIQGQAELGVSITLLGVVNAALRVITTQAIK